MAEKKKMNMAYSYIEVGDEVIKYAEVDLTTGETTFFLPLDEIDAYEKKMMDNVGRNMSRYIENHPESALWEKT